MLHMRSSHVPGAFMYSTYLEVEGLGDNDHDEHSVSEQCMSKVCTIYEQSVCNQCRRENSPKLSHPC